MFTFARNAALVALFAAIAPALGQVTTADAEIVLGDDATCPIPDGPDVNAGVLAVVRFDETVSAVNALGTNLASAEVGVTVCLCVQASAQTGLVEAPVNVRTESRTAILEYLSTSANLDVALTAVKTNLVGNELSVTVEPSDDITECTQCGPTQYPTCEDGRCGCADCPAGQFYVSSLGVCRLPPSQGAAQRMRRSLKPAAAVTRNQAKRSEIVARMANIMPSF